jgi:glycosyltransferase involved in cell wall biosynthesis
MRVSIVTPSFNQGQFIGRTLQSVAIQSGAEIDHIVVDGGSLDNTVDVLKTFGGNIRWVSEKDKGQTDAVNKGIRATSGEIIGWLNSDDVYYPDAISRVATLFSAHPEIDVIYGMADHIDKDDSAFESYPSEPWNFDRLKETCFICQPATFFRRRVIEEYGLLDDNLHYCMDYEFWLRLAKAGARFGYLEDKLAGSRLYAENKTLGSRTKVHAEINDVFRTLFGKAPDRWLWNYAHAVVENKIDREKHRNRFALYMLIVVIWAAWRWNGTVSSDMWIHIKDLWRRFTSS